MSQTVERAIEIVRFTAGQPRSLAEVAELLGVHKSTALRLLQTLEEGGFTRRLPDGRHGAGFALISLAQSALEQMDLRTIARPHLERLNDRIGHTVHLAQIFGDDIVYVDKVEGSGVVAMGSRIGRTVDLHTSGVAKVILAYLPEAKRNEFLRRIDFVPYTTTTILTAGALRHELDLTRQRGWAEDDGEKEEYINCIAFPIFDASRQVVAGISVTALRAALPLERLREGAAEFRSVAWDISRELGWEGETHRGGHQPS